MMIKGKKSIGILGCAALMAAGSGQVVAEDGAKEGGVQADFYGSLRLQGEYVDPGNQNVLGDYFGLRDAYSRIGGRLSYSWSAVTGYAHLEIPLDLANLKIQGPYEQNDTGSHAADQLTDSVRIAKIGVQGDFGNLAFGQDWVPYYNAIAYPVDMFSSYYSGFATYSIFRRNKMLAYYSPSLAGFSFAGGYMREGGNQEADGNYDDRYQLTASFSFGSTTISAGLDNQGGEGSNKLYGLSFMHTIEEAGPGSLYLGGKIERFNSNYDSGYGADGDTAANLYAGYSMGKNTFKAMIAKVDNYGDRIIHLGYDYQWNDNLKLFAEYYNEEETAAITTRRGGAADTRWNADGGQVFLVGARYDF
ncbi:MAG: porin [Halothiobacillaceae bacterium]